MARAGTSTADIRNAVRKTNGKKPSIRAVQQVIAKKKSCPCGAVLGKKVLVAFLP